MQGIVTILALAAVVLLLYRDDVAEAIAPSNEKLGLAVDDEPVRRALDSLAGEEGWTVEHDFLSAHGRRIGTVVHGPSGTYLVETRNRAYRVEHLGRARHHSAWLHGEVGGWVTPVLCLVHAGRRPHRRDGVWIMGVEHSRTGSGRGRRLAVRGCPRASSRAHGSPLASRTQL